MVKWTEYDTSLEEEISELNISASSENLRSGQIDENVDLIAIESQTGSWEYVIGKQIASLQFF